MRDGGTCGGAITLRNRSEEGDKSYGCRGGSVARDDVEHEECDGLASIPTPHP